MLYLTCLFFRCSCSAGFQPILPCCLPHRINVNSQRRTNLPVSKTSLSGVCVRFPAWSWQSIYIIFAFCVRSGNLNPLFAPVTAWTLLYFTIHIFTSSIIQVLGVVLPGFMWNICSTALKHPVEMAVIGSGERYRQSTGSSWLLLVQGWSVAGDFVDLRSMANHHQPCPILPEWNGWDFHSTWWHWVHPQDLSLVETSRWSCTVLAGGRPGRRSGPVDTKCRTTFRAAEGHIGSYWHLWSQYVPEWMYFLVGKFLPSANLT